MIEKKPYHFNNPAWIWARIRAIRNYRAEIDFLESCLMELKRLVELQNRKQPASN